MAGAILLISQAARVLANDKGWEIVGEFMDYE
jgi:hypothetical protein